jgi:hypothetical protein
MFGSDLKKIYKGGGDKRIAKTTRSGQINGP